MVSESIGLREPDRKGTQSFRADVHVGSKLSDADVAGPVIFGEIDQHGNRVCRYIEDASGVIGLNEQGYAGLLKLARAVQKTEPFRDAISVQFLEDVLFRWSVSKLKRETTLTACEYISAEALRAVSRQEIWVPVYGLNIQSQFQIGKVTFKTITRATLDEWHSQIRARVPDNPRIDLKLEREKKDLLGFAAAAIDVEAEPLRAREIAQDLADKAISLLRIFSLASLDPSQFSYCVPLGSHQRYGHHYLFVKDHKIVGDDQGITSKGLFPWVLSNLMIKEFFSGGLTVLSDLLSKTPKTEFESTVFDGLMLYSNAALTPNLAEKLLYVFSGLESILLRNETEPITDNIAERLAYLAARDLPSRLEVRASVKKAYSVRSRFVHHGKREDEDLSKFFLNAWAGMIQLAGVAGKYATKADFLASIDNYKFRP